MIEVFQKIHFESSLDLCQAGYDFLKDVYPPEEGGLVQELVVAVHPVGGVGGGREPQGGQTHLPQVPAGHKLII